MKVIIPVAQSDFDPSEVAIPWKLLSRAGIDVSFATPSGRPGQADPRMLTGAGLGPLAPVLAARQDAVAFYRELSRHQAFLHPLSYADIQESDFDGLLLPGGHAPGMREYLESQVLYDRVASFFARDKPVGAICHGVVVAARTQSPRTGKSILHGRKTTALLRSQELLAWALTCLWLGRYYRTYPITVQDEVTRVLATPGDFVTGPVPLLRDSEQRLERGFTVQDGNYLSARWPGDAYRFGLRFLELLTGTR